MSEPLPRECLKYFAAFIEREIGIVYSEVNYYQLESRLDEIAKTLNLPSSLALWQQVAAHGAIPPAAKALVIDIATNNETSFFRDVNVFKAIRSLVLGMDLSRFTPEKPLRVWSAACSTGQEIYSMAMLFNEIKETHPFSYKILATDISERVLERAKAGRYSQLEVGRGLSDAQRAKYLSNDRSDAQNLTPWTIRPELKQGLEFRKLNLLESWQGMDRFHLVLCRNVLIYQTVDNKKKVLAKLYDCMDPNGVLILGGAESLIGLFDALHYQTVESVVVYLKQKPTTAAAA